MASNDELACTYAALILHDGGKPVTAAAIAAVIKAADLNVTAFWPNFFEKTLKTENLDKLILSAGAPAGGAPAPTAGAAAGAAAPAGAKKEEPKKEEAKKPAKKETTSEDGGD